MANSCALYYFSATGNSLAVALELARLLSIPEPVSIPGSLVLDDPYAAANGASCVGFVVPVHRASLPEMVRGFIAKLPVRPDCYYFAISTYTLFGLNEFADIDELLRAGGAMLNYAAGVKMMGNVGLADPNSRVIRRRLAAMHEQVAEIADAVANRQESYFRRSFQPLSRLVKAFTLRRRQRIVFNVNGRCTRCGICAQVCPAQNIQVLPDGTRAPERSERCEACYACIHWCPANAVSTAARPHAHYHNPNIRPEQLNPKPSQ